MLKVDVITIFPEQIENFMQFGLFRIAKESGALECKAHDLRKWTTDNHKSVDDRPYGGGAGMVMKIEPIYRALEELRQKDSVVVALTPKGHLLKQKILREIVAKNTEHMILIAGHYEGFDQRILDNLVDMRISVGEYVLSGGELPALTLLDGVVRLLPGVLGNEHSSTDESHENNLLEYAQYTRPEEFNGWKVPDVLLSGNHKEITEWRKESSKKMTDQFKAR
ncbi:MAG: tRNA (guanosine(37)-N1)-methyltransferase TrmD [Candidatus Dojkabacteria bacterium]|nr:MAG: tRNA (guanosine(37)-N1)-methyltransferase TrmD [Candidatus Dojkabacteria bacterium]